MLKDIAVWGRSTTEYIQMFDLVAADLKLKILDCAGGPASFNAEMTKQGFNVISCDTIYNLTANEIADRIQEANQPIMNALQTNSDSFVWQKIQSPYQLQKLRMVAMQTFLEDFTLGLQENRYITSVLPSLPFANRQFDLALCSHLLFTYSHCLSQEFHLASIIEMCRVAKQTRIFPLLSTSGKLSSLVQPVIHELKEQGYTVQIKEVAYEFQKGGNKLLQVSSPL
ncbi:MAG: SAM-dependent methyltransferase [Hapalosiphonaceae cyanobacterium JJU2]|nr:MAG: SAM-dependent methyltransferase [Hapalosiphonaceae cyanobacterium JJU2]